MENISFMKTIETTFKKIERDFGKGAIMVLGEDNHIDIEKYSSGSYLVDKIIGGGIPKGRIIEIFGPESSGKTTLSLQILASWQRQGKNCAFIDAEHALNIDHAMNLGVDPDRLIISQPDFGEQALQITESLIKSEKIDLIVIDSTAALTPKGEIDGNIGDIHVGLQARMMSQALRKLTAICNKTGTTLIFINQLRQKVGVTFGSPETTPGGNALKFYSSLRLDIRRIGGLKVKDQLIGNRIRIKSVKNKLAAPFAEAETELYFDRGLDPISEIFDLALEKELIEKSGSWFSLGDSKLGQGKPNCLNTLIQNDQMIFELVDKLGLETAPIERFKNHMPETKN